MNGPEKINASLKIDAVTHREIKILCIKAGKSLKEWLLAAVVAAYENEIERTQSQKLEPPTAFVESPLVDDEPQP